MTDPTPHRRRVLIVTPTVPYPPNWGFGIRVFNIVKELQRTCDVEVVCYADDADAAKVAELRNHCHAVHSVRAPLSTARAKRLAQLRSTVSRRSFQSLSWRSSAMSALLQRLLATGGFDIVQLESSQLVSVAEWGPAPWVIDEHNLEYELLQRMYEVERSPLRKAYNWLEFKKFRNEELAAWQRCSGCVLTSKREQQVFSAQRPTAPSHVAPNGVDIDHFTPCTDPPEPNSIVFTGLMSYRPNTDGATFFVREVMPLILERRPSAVFTIVGLAAEQSVGFLAGPNVRVVSNVPDVRPYVHNAAVVAVPLRMGSGTRLKILEGLAMGKALVSTTIGCEGIDVADDRDLLIADEPAAFATAVLRVLDDRDAASRLGRAGRALVEDHYSWTSIVDELARFHDSVVRPSATTDRTS